MLETERLYLKSYKKEDLDSVLPILSDPHTMSFWPAPFTREQAEAWVDKQVMMNKQIGFGRFVVIEKKTNQIIGDCGIMRAFINGKEENDLGYIIDAKKWRQGYGYEAAKASLDYAIHQLGLSRICANMAYNHSASIRLAEKLGMIKEEEYRNERNRNLLTYVYVWKR
ncbi:GNAT family N-acetyltransferase [Brevibacillus migulae]|uniref:GNAT family N-acetyltransferase n=1 Tax=Brevibacillus migulae TaxID=1644114 RepID=UPI00142FAEF1|nr:GNAT family N-acetyltransferase [Brevibacillus migulae]